MYGLWSTNARCFCSDHCYNQVLLQLLQRCTLMHMKGYRVGRLIVSLRPWMPGRCIKPDVLKTGFDRCGASEWPLQLKCLKVWDWNKGVKKWKKTSSRTSRLETSSKRTCPRDRTPGKATPSALQSHKRGETLGWTRFIYRGVFIVSVHHTISVTIV